MYQLCEPKMIPGSQIPRVSVIIPCYNHAHFLGDAIQSVLDQTCRDFEIIVVDDGSTDDTPKVAASFGDRVRYIHQDNKGLSAARNAGILAATGEFIGFLDADDLWLSSFLQLLTPILERDQCLGAVYCGSQFIDSQGNSLPQTVTRTYPADQLHSVLTNGEFFPPSAVLVRRSVFQNTETFDESLNASEDWDMWLRISGHYRFAGVPDILALYRMHGNSMSRDLDRMLHSQIQVARKHFGPGTGDAVSWTAERQRAYAGIYLWHAIARYQRSEPNLGAEFVQRALFTYPGVARSLDTFYALACAEQPPGHTGNLENLNLKRSANRVLATLDAIFADAKIPNELKSNRYAAYGMAYFALGILAYGQRNLGQARKYLGKALVLCPAVTMNRQWVLTFAKALLGQRLLNVLLDWKHARAIST